MNFYDKVHELVRSLKNTEEYKKYVELKNKVKADERLNDMIKNFKIKQMEEQKKYLSGADLNDQVKQNLQQEYSLIIQNPLAVEFFQAEIKLDVILADMQKILSEGFSDIVEF